ncbi:hypothetical protein K466DRAFT_581687 [Polyporus arcularius HHB13444]|uniref:Uncharacterized protein n=1 Tax=Polyporus arcularius HHB13444 TaxID=1314778 RepID=A0A5C3PVD3_9APHY|nr:hypothetical protein K466DRAFT_581687 [Polyporus arcularius HHB13444]
MYSTLVSVALFSTLAIQGALADFAVNTVDLVQCEPVQLTWDNVGSKSYNVALVSSANPCDDVLAEYGDHSVNHITVTPALKAGEKVLISVLGDNEDGWSGEITVKQGKDDSCLPAALRVASSSSSSAAPSTSSTAAAASVSGTTLVVNPAAGPTGAGSAPAAPSSTGGGASAVGAAGSGVLGNGAFASVHFSASTLALSAIAAVAALAF